MTTTHKSQSAPRADLTPRMLSLLQRIQGEYREMPGLSLTVDQAGRLWGLDRNTCSVALSKLTELHVLRRTDRGFYIRSSD